MKSNRFVTTDGIAGGFGTLIWVSIENTKGRCLAHESFLKGTRPKEIKEMFKAQGWPGNIPWFQMERGRVRIPFTKRVKP